MQKLPKIILGIDPGSHNTGFGVVSLSQGKLSYVEHGVISAKATSSFSERIELIGREVSQLILRISPDITVVEKIFLGKNADSAFKLGHIRGICIFEALKVKSEIVEYAARSVKKGITGSGAATKEQVQMMLYAGLGIKATSAMKLDASDALSLSFYHARTIEFQMRLNHQVSRQKELL